MRHVVQQFGVRCGSQDPAILLGRPGKIDDQGRERGARHIKGNEGKPMENETPRFVVARVDRRGELPTTYLRNFALVGRSGLRELAFGLAATAHLFDRRAEAEDIARKLGRRV